MDTYEKKYKNALEWARQVMTGETGFIQKEVEEVFPELKKSGDEIRKEIISALKNANYKGVYDKHLAWLEKQGEKATDEMIETFRTEYEKGRADAIAEMQGEQKPYGLRGECSDCQVNYAGECKGSCELKRNEQKPQRIISAEAKEALYGKPAWSEEDERNLNATLAFVETIEDLNNAKDGFRDIKLWLKSLKDRVQPQSQWKPSEEMLEALYRATPENVMEKSEDEMLLDKLYQGLKYGKVLSKK